MDVEGRVRIDGEVKVVGAARTKDDEVGADAVRDRAARGATRDKEATVRNGQRRKASSVNRDRGSGID